MEFKTLTHTVNTCIGTPTFVQNHTIKPFKCLHKPTKCNHTKSVRQRNTNPLHSWLCALHLIYAQILDTARLYTREELLIPPKAPSPILKANTDANQREYFPLISQKCQGLIKRDQSAILLWFLPFRVMPVINLWITTSVWWSLELENWSWSHTRINQLNPLPLAQNVPQL